MLVKQAMFGKFDIFPGIELQLCRVHVMPEIDLNAGVVQSLSIISDRY